jgi:hypothetical protein
MAASSNSGSRRNWIRYANLNCKCNIVSEIKVSLTHQNPNRLFYSCKENKCKWVGWCEPIPDDIEIQKTIETNDRYGEARMSTMVEEVNNLKKELEGLSEGIQEEVCTMKYEFEKGMSTIKKDVNDELSMLKKHVENQFVAAKNDFDNEVLTLKTKLKEMEQCNGKLKFLIFGVMFVIVLILICNHI